MTVRWNSTFGVILFAIGSYIISSYMRYQRELFCVPGLKGTIFLCASHPSLLEVKVIAISFFIVIGFGFDVSALRSIWTSAFL